MVLDNNVHSEQTKYEAIIVGGGIAGLESALNLANIGYKVLIVEKDLSVGGKMIHLSKVFPTLDCAACITTPKVSEATRHPHINILTNSEIVNIDKNSDGYFTGTVKQKPRFVIESKCTGCQLCEEKCPVIVKDEYQYDLVGRKVAYIPFSIASPRIAAIDIENCILCGACEKVCAPCAIDFSQEELHIPVIAKTVLVTTGFNLFDPENIDRYGGGKLKNVITSMQMERQLVPTRPYNSVLRPGDGKMPDNIAYVLCTGSRDATVGNPICSQVCCMYSIKQSQLIMGALPMADVTIYYLHIRASGKAFNEFYKQSEAMGVEFVNGKIGKIAEKEDGNLILRYEDIESGIVKEAEHDMVVLSVGILANNEITKSFNKETLGVDPFNYIKQTDEVSTPAKTTIEGVFVAGTSVAPMDIPDTISSAGAASAQAACYIENFETNN